MTGPLVGQHKSLAFLLGLGSIAAQSLLFREHLLAYSGNELGTGGFLAAWMLWIALGALLGRSRLGSSQRAGVAAFTCFPLALLLEMVLIWKLRELGNIPPGAAFPLTSLLAWTSLAVFPVSLLSGFAFAWLARRPLQGPEEPVTVGQLYALEALGSGAGGLLASAATYGGLSAGAFYLALGFLWSLALAMLWPRGRGSFAWVAAILAVAHLGAWATQGTQWLANGRLSALGLPEGVAVVESRDTPWHHLAVARFGDSQVLLVDGRPSQLFPDPDGVTEAALIQAFASPAPSILVLGFGALERACQLVRHEAGSVVLVGLDGDLLEMVAQHVPDIAGCLVDERLEVVVQDPQDFVASSKEAFDLVVYAVGEPAQAASTRFYTTEFFRRVGNMLTPNGLLTFDITATENVLAGPELAYVGTVYQTLQGVFGSVGFTALEEMRFFASNSSGTLATEAALTRVAPLHHRRYPEVPIERLQSQVNDARIAGRVAALGTLPASLIVSMDRPSIYFQRVQALEPEGSWFRGLRVGHGRYLPWLWGLLVSFGAALLLAGGRKGGRGELFERALLVATGACGMAGQVLLLLGFQLRFGTLYAAFGGLNAAFLVGLAAGSGGLPKRVGKAVVLALAPMAAGGALWGVLQTGADGFSFTAFAFGPLVLGIATGMGLRGALVGLAAHGHGRGGQAVTLELLDHLGAAAGGLMAGAFLVPGVGLSNSALWLAGVAAIPLVLYGAQRLGWRWPDPGAVPAMTLRVAVIWGGLVAVGSMAVAVPSTGAPDPERGSVTLTGANGASQRGSSWPGCHHIDGWGGPMELVVGLSEDGLIEGVSMGRNHETPEYLVGIHDWLAQFKGRRAQGLLFDEGQGDYGVDAFTGATVTGEAVVAILRCMAAPADAVASGGQAWDLPAHAGRGLMALLLTLVGGLVCLLAPWRWRTIWLLALLVVAGFWLNQQLAFTSLGRGLVGPRPPLLNVVFWVTLGGALLWGLMAGAVHCGALCPAGAAQSLLGRLGMRWRVAPWLDRRLRHFKYVVAILMIWAPLVVHGQDWSVADPLRTLFSLRHSGVGMATIAMAILVSLVWHRPWCRYLCPLGAVLSLAEPAAFQHRVAPTRRTADCHLGVRVGVDWDCVRCHRCVGPDPLPAARWAPGGFVADALLVVATATLLVLGGLQVAFPAQDQASAGTWDSRNVVEEGVEELPPGPGAGVTSYRKDNEPYPHQRSPGAGTIRDWLRGGKIAGRRALHYLSVPDAGGR